MKFTRRMTNVKYYADKWLYQCINNSSRTNFHLKGTGFNFFGIFIDNYSRQKVKLFKMRGFASILWGFVAICGVVAVPQKIHEKMTTSERMQVFKTINTKLPDYEITRIHWPKYEKRAADAATGIYLKAFGEDIELWLQPTDEVLAGYDTPVYFLKTGTSGPQVTKYSNVMETLHGWEDVKNSAALVVRERGNRSTRSIIGTIASRNLTIAPIPERLVEEVRRQRRSSDEIPSSDQEDHHYHIVYKMPQLSVGPKYPDLLFAETDNKIILRAKSFPVPDTIYPEVLVVITHDLYEKLGKDVWYAAGYALAFWNGVDLKYRYFENPKFRLNIAGIVLTEDDEALEYMAAYAYNENTTIATDALRGSMTYWYARKSDIPISSYDVVVTMTSNSLCSFYGEKTCSDGILGQALVGGACQVSDYWQENHNVAIIHDEGAFNGIHTAAHELGHLFGALHDGDHHEDCPYFDGYIMAAAPRLTDKSAQWSNCTVRDIQKFLETNPSCLYNKPTHSSVLPGYLPGRLIDAHKQCEILEGTRACEIDSSICQVLKCINRGNEAYCKGMISAAADGTECGDDKICLNGRCIRPPRI